VDALHADFLSQAAPRVADPARFLGRAIEHAHESILVESRRLELAQAPFTTVVACLVQEGRVWWSHVGDSRFYLMRKGRIAARTRDHTPVQRLVDAGRVREEAASSHPQRNKLLQCLGIEPAPQFEPVAGADLELNDVLLVCSDGLWGPLTPRQLMIGLIGKALDRAVADLIELALARAGADCDNVSVVALHWQEPGARARAQAPAFAPPRAALRASA
jgi:serine/threonine protein phosphatase PrpC